MVTVSQDRFYCNTYLTQKEYVSDFHQLGLFLSCQCTMLRWMSTLPLHHFESVTEEGNRTTPLSKAYNRIRLSQKTGDSGESDESTQVRTENTCTETGCQINWEYFQPLGGKVFRTYAIKT